MFRETEHCNLSLFIVFAGKVIKRFIIFAVQVMDEEKVDEEANGFIQSLLLQPRQLANPPGSRFNGFVDILFTNYFFPFPFMIDLQALLHRKGSGDVSSQENEAVVHILIVEVNTYHKQRKRIENLFRLLR